MRRSRPGAPPAFWAAAALLCGAALALAGCGGSSGAAKTATKASPPGGAPPPVIHQANYSRASLGVLVQGGVGRHKTEGDLDAQYTCKGRDTWPRIAWTPVPESTKEIVVLVRTLADGHLWTDFALGHIGPNFSEVREGRVPPGAVVGRNSFGEVGYKVCPPAGHPALALFAVLALPYTLQLQPGFSPSELARPLKEEDIAWGSTNWGVASTAGP